ncbi:hypothetical protein COCSUDRAFT_47508 [Coccomyxa subellipsoidea C-169]|uniref:Fatty acid synthase n=1 Tax=Coccomyxa subellipsoidea (strain C-169) TaxID=574566 RepID=I0YXM1_COCSC|nr:hypothetical protein COCSUDRAFT_47508 [Coccomyxa subellipsoidea C-169]EIE23140.1 hypothetical protein COCSUDRAFT_47508 [Coccomyxa subellipsoidea C-169]|eukprot:XP_005647684.1 hypothetical protein COCSUDRAFT_47508 [Coccomyxa subellipsoidea C-169]
MKPASSHSLGSSSVISMMIMITAPAAGRGVAAGTMADIIGLSCRFPESNGPAEFWSNLMDGTDMLTCDDRRWPVGFQGLPPRSGKAPGFDKFDAAFFSVHGKQAQKMDPQLRKLLEVAYEAWVDAGVDFSALRGSEKVGVYVGACGSETHAQWLGDIDSITGYEQSGCAQSMFANRLSWWFDFRGPSKCIDTACSSSLMAFNDAISDLDSGRIDYAIVGGASGIFRPQTSIAFQRLHMMSPDGTCKSFDASANGYARSDGIAIVVLRRTGLSDIPVWASRHPYARVLACATNNDGHTKEGITFPSGPAQKALAQEVCAKAGLEPSAVDYIEAHGTGTVAGDGQELGALEEWYGRTGGRTAENPLLIGSVKSNMGHCEGCSGLAALIKVLLSYEHKTLPGNLHFKEPNPNNAGLKDGILKVVTEPTKFKGITALSNFGFGGSNVHLLLSPGDTHEAVSPINEEGAEEADAKSGATPAIIPLASRTKEGMADLVKVLQGLPGGEKSVLDPLRRLANSVGGNVARLSTRGTLIDGELRSAQAPTTSPPVWFVFTGNGSQWPKMGRELIEQNATFRESIKICASVLTPLGLDLLEAFEKEDGFSEARLAAVGLASVQIGLVDVLREEYGITPGGVLGHSAGEIACGYGDGCFTREQTVLVAYHRGRMCPEHGISGGLMAAVGLGADEAEARLVKHGKASCVVGCDNSPTSTTLSGPEGDLKPLLEQLKAEGVFVRELDTRGLAFHSPVLQSHLPELQAALEEVVPEPKERSATWLSSTYAVDDESPEARLCSGAYQTHGYASRVQFRLACSKIPKDVILLEIGPHALMRSPLRQNRSDLQYVATMKKGDSAVDTLKAAIADLWRKGAAINWSTSVTPAPSATPELPRVVREALVSWDHASDYPLPKSKDWTSAGGSSGFTKTYKLGGEHAFLADHVVDGRILMPATSYLVTAWEALATQHEKTMAELPVVFEDVSIVQAVQAQPGENVTLSVLLDRSHRFQVLQETDIIAEGRIKPRSAPAPAKKEGDAASAEAPADTVAPAEAEAAAPTEEAKPEAAAPADAEAQEEAEPEKVEVEWPYNALDTVDAGTFYLDVARAGIQYGPHFRMVEKRHIDGKAVVLRWDGCFIRLLDGMLQAGALGSADYNLRIPTKIRHLAILDSSPAIPAGSQVMVDVDAPVDVCRTELCEVAGVELSSAPRRPINYKTLLKKMDFLPYGENLDKDAKRLAYYKQIRGYIKALVEPAIIAHGAASADGMPDHLQKVLVMLEDFKEPAPEGAELEAFLSGPKHHLARLIRDLFAEEASATTMENPIQAIVQHAEHNVLYAQDPLMQGFHARHISHMLDIVCENQGQTGFTVAEIGAGTGGFTRQVIAELDRSPFSELRGYTATDITPAFGPNLLQMVGNSKLEFKTWDVNKPAPDTLGGPFDLILASNAVHTCDNMAETLANVHASLADGGFLLLYETTAAFTTCLWGLDERTWKFTDEREYGLWMAKPRWHRLWAEAGFTQIVEHWCPHESGALFLYRKLPSVPEPVLFAAPPLVATEEHMEGWLKEYNDALAAVDPEAPKEAAPAEGEEAAEPAKVEQRLWLHGNLRDNPGVLGLGHCARLEAHGDNLRWMLDAHHPSSALTSCAGPAAKPDPKLTAEQMLAIAGRMDLVNNIFQNGVHGSLRNTLVELNEVDNAAALEKAPKCGVHLDIVSPGDISSFFWAHSQAPPPGLVECNVAYGSLNFRDVMLAYGKLSKDLMSHANGGNQIGLEFSGKDKVSGKRIMGMTPQNSIATMVASKPHALWDVPDSWTLAQAATVPVAYATAYDALVVRGRLQPHHRVLIHSASGAVGLAATRICLNRGCEVFVTCGTADKRAFLLEAFPTLREDHIGDSRSCAFEEVVKRQTNGTGVHLALNSLADDKLQATVRCLADNGRLLEIGKYDILKGTPLSMRPMLRNVAFEGIDLDRITNDPSNITEAWEVHALLTAGISSGEVVPLPLNKFSRKEAGNAFRFMAAGTHMGKVLIQMASDGDSEEALAAKAVFKWPAPPAKAEEEEGTEAVEATAAPAIEDEPAAKPVFFCKSDRSYIITGGVGGFGLALAVWLSNRGARNLVLTSKRGMRTGGQRKVVQMLQKRGVQIEVSKLDVADLGETEQIVALAEGMAPVGGIFHLAMILQDRWMSNQTGESWNAPIIPKAYGALNLDKVSQKLPHLEQFVIFSSVVSSTGNEGQGNYGYANSVCDMLCMSRRAAGLPALALAWGPVDHVGYVAEILKGKLVGRVFEWLLPQPVDDCLRVLASCLLGGKEVTPLMCSTTETVGSNSADGEEDTDLVEAVLSLMGLKADAVGENDNLAALGIDSMQLMEVRAVMQKKLCRPVPLETIGTLTVATLRELAAEAGSKGGRSAPKAAAADDSAAADEGSAPAEEAPAPQAQAAAPEVEAASKKKAEAASAGNVVAQQAVAGDKKGGDGAGEISITASAVRQRKAAKAAAVPDKPAASAPAPAAAGSPPKARTVSSSASPKAATATATKAQTTPAASNSTWGALTFAGVLYIGAVLAVIGAPALSVVTAAASVGGLFAVVLVVPAIWLCVGVALCLACVATSRLLQPKLSANRPLPMFSLEFARWWLVSRLVHVTTIVFAEHLRGTPFLTWWYRALGARIGKGGYIDSLDVCDFDLITIGDNVVVNEGSTIIGHFFRDGQLHFSEIMIGDNCSLAPFSMAKAGTVLPSGASIGPQATGPADPKKRAGKAPVLAALKTQLASPDLTAAQTAGLQVAGLWAIGAVATVCAVVAYGILGTVLSAAGLSAHIALCPAAFAVFALAALFNPLYAATLPILLPIGAPAAWSALGTVLSPVFAVAAIIAVPLSMTVFGASLAAASVLFKWQVAGKVSPGVYRHQSVLGVRIWTASRMVELAFKRFMTLLSGTWAMNVYLRALGATVGDWVSFRLGMCLPLCPDQITIKDGVHVGDMANLVCTYAIDGERSVTAPVTLEAHSLIGAAAVALPGTTLGKSATLGAGAASLAGAQLPGEMLYMGNPATPVFKSSGSDKAAGPTDSRAKLMFASWPLVQPLLAFGITTLATYATIVAALATTAIFGSQGSWIGALVAGSALWTMYGALLGSLGAAAKWSFTGKLEPHAGFSMYDSLSFRRALVLISEMPLGPFAEAVRASPWYNLFASLRGMTIGKGAYLDSTRLLDYELASFGDNAIVSRNALVYCHLASHKKGKLVVYQKRSSFGVGSVLGARAITLPGYTLADKAALAPVGLGAPPMTF